jgi:hypothetical protein
VTADGAKPTGEAKINLFKNDIVAAAQVLSSLLLALMQWYLSAYQAARYLPNEWPTNVTDTSFELVPTNSCIQAWNG